MAADVKTSVSVSASLVGLLAAIERRGLQSAGPYRVPGDARMVTATLDKLQSGPGYLTSHQGSHLLDNIS